MRAAGAKIGPNAILQLAAVLQDAIGPARTAQLMAQAGIVTLPDPAEGLIDEGPVARLHQTLRRDMPDVAPMLAWDAGWRTANYILAHRIPAPVQRGLRLFPARLAAPILSRAIAKNAWTFCGSGEFRLAARWPPVFEIAANPVVRGETARMPLCHWHAAVFERLFGALCGPGWRAVETRCCAQGARACRFELHRAG